MWAPALQKVMLKITAPEKRDIPLEVQETGYWQKVAEDVKTGSRYYFALDGENERPDPASNFQPEGVLGPSEIVDHNSFKWSDSLWKGIPLEQMIMYELHVGTFTEEGTFAAIIERLDDLLEFGINALELMPVAQFPGERNWGYDGVYPFAVQNSYGGPQGLKMLVDACHKRNIAVILDVVYNHLGPEGNFLRDFGPYFTDKYKTPWGQAVNFDDKCSDEVRHFFISNAIFWFQRYHIDALRLDALHAIYDISAKPFLRELAETVEDFSRNYGRKFCLIGESDLNDIKIISAKEQGGYGIDAQWCDEFHHSLHTLLTGEKNGYYADFGEIGQLVKSLQEGFVYSWQYSKHRARHFGSSSKDIPAAKFVVFSQNHDQTGNRMLGERLSTLVSFESLKLAAGAVLFSPYIPLLFMGEECAEESPFLYFVSHNDPSLVAAVREGRKNEFKAFEWKEELPDPQAVDTFLKSKIRWKSRNEGRHKILLEFYKYLIRMRKEIPALSYLSKENLRASSIDNKNLIFLHRRHNGSEVICFMNFEHEKIAFSPDVPAGKWIKLVDSAAEKWGGSGSTLTEVIERGQNLTIPPLTFAAFELKTANKKVEQ